jgi:hypothetical protein
MNIVFQYTDYEKIMGLAEASEASKFETSLWNVDNKSIFDMFYEKRPDLVVVAGSFFKNNFDEFNAAVTRYGGKVFAQDVFIDQDPFIGHQSDLFATITQKPNRQPDTRFKCDIALIANNIDKEEYEYIYEIIKMIDDMNVWQFRIYGNTELPTPYYVGKVTRQQIRDIYRNTTFLIDIKGEHYLNSFLFNNFAVCTSADSSFDKYENCYSIEEIKNRLAEIIPVTEERTIDINLQQKIEEWRKEVVTEHNNLKALSHVLNRTNFNEESKIVKQVEKELINEHWFSN